MRPHSYVEGKPSSCLLHVNFLHLLTPLSSSRWTFTIISVLLPDAPFLSSHITGEWKHLRLIHWDSEWTCMWTGGSIQTEFWNHAGLCVSVRYDAIGRDSPQSLKKLPFWKSLSSFFLPEEMLMSEVHFKFYNFCIAKRWFCVSNKWNVQEVEVTKSLK